MDLINNHQHTGFDLKTEKYILKKYITNHNAIHEWLYKCLLDVELKIKNDLGVWLQLDALTINDKEYWVKQCNYNHGLLESHLSKNYDVFNVKEHIYKIINYCSNKEKEFLALELNYS